MATNKGLGELLVKRKIITDAQLERALQEIKPGETLERVLIRLGFVSPQDLFDVGAFDPNLLRLLPPSVARRYGAIPCKLENNHLYVAMVDPLNIVAIDDLRLITGYEIEPLFASEEEINEVLAAYYNYNNGKSESRALQELDINLGEQQTAFFELGGDESDAPVVKIVDSIIQQAVRAKASDIHFEPQEDRVRIRFRVDGVLREIMFLPKVMAATLVSRVKIMAEMDIAEKRLPQDGRVMLKVDGRPIDLRVSTLPTLFGEKIVMRILDKANQLIKLDDLGLTPRLLEGYRQLIHVPYGMILVTGPAGSGKTTTLYATLSELNSSEKNIVTIEEPVEYVLEGINQIGVNNKAGLTFATGLRSILRQDPDVIMIGEIRDGETADIAVRAATTGHLVFSTLHTNDAAGALLRLVDMGVEPFLVASSVIGVLAQRLVRRICSRCKTTYFLPEHAPERLFLGEGPVILYKGEGCQECGHTGYKGRVAILEILRVTSGIRDLIMQKATAEQIKQKAREEGMLTLLEDGILKVKEGITTVEEVMRVTYSAASG